MAQRQVVQLRVVAEEVVERNAGCGGGGGEGEVSADESDGGGERHEQPE